VRHARNDGPRKKPSLKAGAMSLLTNPDVMIFFVMVTLMGFAKGVVDSFLFIFIDELGVQKRCLPAICESSQMQHVGEVPTGNSLSWHGTGSCSVAWNAVHCEV
jgi:hypothetical protein